MVDLGVGTGHLTDRGVGGSGASIPTSSAG